MLPSHASRRSSGACAARARAHPGDASLAALALAQLLSALAVGTRLGSGAIKIVLPMLVVRLCSLVVVEKDVEAIEFCPVHAIEFTASPVSTARWACSSSSPSDIN